MKYLLYLILSNLLFVSPQLNLYYTNSVNETERNSVLQYNCLRVPDYVKDDDSTSEVISYCMNEFSSTFMIETVDFHTKFTFNQLAKDNITSQQLYLWSAPIDLIEDYQFYLNQLSTDNNSSLANQIFYNCTWPKFGLECQYELYFYSPPPLHSSSYDIIHDFYKNFPYNPTSLTCYKHLQCQHRIFLACLDWTEICDGNIDCLNDGVDEEHCWQLDINQCKDDEYRCRNGQCIIQSFHKDDDFTPDCFDRSDDGLSISAFFTQVCHTNVPSFRCEDVICYTTYSPRSCIFLRRNILLESISWNKTNSTSEECWSASKCLLRSSQSVQEFCEHFCANNTCINIIARSCPDILDIPDNNFAFGNLYLTHKNIMEQNLISQNIWELYICYSMSYYDAFFHMFPKMTLNNRTCFFYETISLLFTEADIYITNQTSLVVLYDKVKKYHRIYDYNSIICNQSNMYQCMNSSKCISIYRLLDKVEDCPYTDDENMTFINNSHIVKQMEKTHFKCQKANKFIHQLFVDDVACDCGFDEYYQCEDENVFYHTFAFDPYMNISFQTICDGVVELKLDKQNETDETECQHWACDNMYTHCDGVWHCLNGADEINCNLSSLSKCPKDHHQCVSSNTTQLICLPIEKINDGNIDCLSATDEIVKCRKKYASLQSENFYCKKDNITTCMLPRYFCDGTKNCDNGDDEQICEKNRTLISNSRLCSNENLMLLSDMEKVICNQIKGYTKEAIIFFTLDGMKNLNSIPIKKNIEKTMVSSLSKFQLSTNSYQSYCQRGLHLHVWLNNTVTNDTCLCPPSYYGSQCQYQNQRISLTIKFRAFSDSYRTLFTIIISLIDNSDDRIIHSYEQITYLPYIHCRNKFNIYLLYSTRAKNQTGQYHIHIDFYEKISLTYRGSVLLPVVFPFLPVQRLAFFVDIPSINSKESNRVVKYQCVHGKPIHYSNNSDISSFCQCDSGWSGRYCTIKSTCNCASDSKCLGIAANNRSICVCRIHKFGSRCLLTNQICENTSLCQNGGQCIASDEYLRPKQKFICLCQPGFRGDECDIVEAQLILSFDKNIISSQSIFIHFIEVNPDKFPARSTTFRTMSFAQDSLSIHWSQPFHLVFIEFDHKNYYIAVKQTIYNKSTTINSTIHSSDRCSHIREVLNATIVQWDLIRRIKYYHQPCQNSLMNLSCFYDEDQMCLCYKFQEQRLANCFNFTNITFDCSGQSVCENDGKCLQDNQNCPTRSICMCLSCFYGTQCQFSTSGFGLSLDAILGYQILPNITLNQQPLIVKISFVLTIIFMIIGLLDSIISMMTFKNKIVREVGCGLYLLGSSITTLLTMIMFGLKFFILLIAQMTVINNRSFLVVQCHSIDFLLRIGIYTDQWLNACVAVERAYTITEGVTFNKKKSKRNAKFIITLLVIIIAISCIHDPIFRRLIDEESNDDGTNVKRTWCIVKYGSSLHLYDSILNTIHFFGPFMMNLMSTIILIKRKSRQQAIIQKKRLYQDILIEQLQKNKHLLTAPTVLAILALPRLIITFISTCLKSSDDVWIFLVGYFISFIPPMLTSLIFILPSKFYTKEFKKTMTQITTMIQHRFRRTL